MSDDPWADKKEARRRRPGEPTAISVPPDPPKAKEDTFPAEGEPMDMWWYRTVEGDVAKTTPKIREYGTRDLEAMGQALLVGKGISASPQQASIYGCMFYALGKTMRAIAAIERGEDPSEDTLFDLSIYSMMARSFNERGRL